VVLQRSLLEEKGLDWLPYFEVDEVYARLSAHLQQVVLENQITRRLDDRIRRTPLHINAAEGFVFVSLLGEVFPSGYLPMSAGNVTQTSLMEIYQHSDLFISLRNKKALLGRCGICEYNTVCGGSRSRAYAVTGNVLAEEPFCSYQPGSFSFNHKIFDTEIVA
jgi:radical SAM protein with 4Fe4S-binding SPASM domain